MIQKNVNNYQILAKSFNIFKFLKSINKYLNFLLKIFKLLYLYF